MNAQRNGSPNNRRPLSTKKKLFFTTVVFSLFLIILYAGTIGWRTHRLYKLLKTERRGWKNRIHQSDAELGYCVIPGITTAELFPIGPEVPTRTDAHGFRIPMDDASLGQAVDRPLVMALGCSFTFGAACLAEEAYPYLVAGQLKGQCINAGVCSFGLTQMLLRARKIIPQFQPDIVLVQYSPWLVDRALSCYSPTYFGRQPVPYFFDGDDGLEIQPPPFTASPIDPRKYDQTPRSMSDYRDFAAHAGIPLLLHDDGHGLLTWLQQALGTLPDPTDRRQETVDRVYRELEQLCADAGATMVIVILDSVVPEGEREILNTSADVPVADAHAALVSRVADGPAPYRNMMFQKMYAHWRGDPPVKVDDHPNRLAHEVITQAIITALGHGKPAGQSDAVKGKPDA